MRLIHIVFFILIVFNPRLLSSGLKEAASKWHIYAQISDCFSSLMDGERVMKVESIKADTWGGGIYRLKTLSNNYVLRFMNQVRTPAELEQERDICALMGEYGISPTIYASSLEKRALIMDEINGSNLLSSKLTKKQIRELGQKIRLIQNVPLNREVMTLTPKENVKKVVSIFNITLPENFNLALNQLQDDFEMLENEENYVLVHSDLNPGNICEDNSGLKIIDWEDAQLSHPYIDIATLLIFYDLDHEDFNLLLHSYTQDNVNAIDLKKLEAAYRVMNLLYAIKLYSISRHLPVDDKKNLYDERKKMRRLFQAKNWKEIFSNLNNQDTTFAIALLYLEKSLLRLKHLE